MASPQAVGQWPPADIAAWKFETGTSNTDVVIEFPPALAPGTKVGVTAFWVNAKMESGPACEPVANQIQFGGISKAA